MRWIPSPAANRKELYGITHGYIKRRIPTTLMDRKSILTALAFLLFSLGSLWGQTPASQGDKTVRGRITDEAGEPLIGAAVVNKTNGKGVEAGADGTYSIVIRGRTLLELQTEKLRLLNELKCADDKDIPKVQSEIAKIESTLATMEKANSENSSKLLKLLSQYKVYRERAKSFNPAEFMRARSRLRPAKEKSAQAKLKSAYGNNFRESTFLSAITDTDMSVKNNEEAVKQNISQQQKTIQR